MSSTISFGRTPAEAIEYFEKKGLKLTWDYDEMMYEAHHKAFTVAKVTKLDLLSDIQSSLQKAMKEGQNYKDWHKNIKPTLQQHGWYGKTEVFNPDTGEFKTITVGSKRLKNIFDTNMRVSYARAAYQQQMGFKLAVYWRYNSMLLETTRASHRSRHGIVKHRDDPWWNINYPPNDWNCKCFITAHTAKDIEKKGWSVHKGALDDIAGKDWAYNVGRDDNIEAVYRDKLKKLGKKGNDELLSAAAKDFRTNKEQNDYAARISQLNEMIDEVIVNQDQKYPVRFIEVGALSASIVQAVKEKTDKEIEDLGIVLEKNRLLHAKPERKNAYDQALRVDELRQIVDVLDQALEVYIDTRDGEEAIIFVFADTNDDTKVNKIVVNFNYLVKKFGKTNAVITLGKINREDIIKWIKGGIYEKVD